jgi:hypothetical protein
MRAAAASVLRRLPWRSDERSAKRVEPELRPPDYRARHAGETLVVLGNGPTLSTHADALRALIAERSAVVLGANHVTPFTHPDYHAFTNRKRFATFAETVDRERSRLLLAPYIPEEFVRRHWDGDYETIAYVDDNDAPFGIDDGIVQASCRTVSVLLIAVAHVMGAREVLVAGLDGFPDGVPEHHVRTAGTKDDPAHMAAVDGYTRRFLGEMREFGVPFWIVTPTAYEEHHDPEPLGASS